METILIILGITLMIIFSIGISLILVFEIFRFRTTIQLSKEKESKYNLEHEKELYKQQQLNVELTNSYKEILKLQTEQSKNENTNLENQTFPFGKAITETLDEIGKKGE